MHGHVRVFHAVLCLAWACSTPRASVVALEEGGAPVEPAASASVPAEAELRVPWQLDCLQANYPETRARNTPAGWVLQVADRQLVLDDGVARVGDDRLEHPDVLDVFADVYPRLAPLAPALADPGRARLDALLSATYGATAAAVERALVPVFLVSGTVRVHAKVAPALARVNQRLQKQDVSRFFQSMGGTFADRDIAGTERKSAHAYGIAIDIGTAHADYWRNAPRVAGGPAAWRNRIPETIVHAFEAEGFVWGGRWRHYDTMHFEYRPELLDAECKELPAPPPAVSAATPTQTAPARASYAWKDTPGALPAVDALHERFSPPQGASWQLPDAGSFGAYLLGLPLAAAGTPVRSYRGDEIVVAGDPRIAAVTTLDVGTQDLQQCADAVLRLHAEYNFQAKRDDRLRYRAASTFEMPFSRWLAGDRFVAKGNDLVWSSSAAPSARSHAALRSWLDRVFTYANTVSVARDASSPARADVRAGDFFVQGGWPGHAVMILALARDAQHTWALLGQSYMPAQSFQVLAHEGQPWFSLDGDSVETPFWRPFAWSDLRRLP